jgi:hypothetical protein
MYGLKGVIIPYKKLIKDGFDFNEYDYKANLLITTGKEVLMLENVLIINDMAICINADGTNVFITKPSENKNVTIQRIDNIELN